MRAQNGLQTRLEKEIISRKDKNGLQNGVGPNAQQPILKLKKIAKKLKKANKMGPK